MNCTFVYYQCNKRSNTNASFDKPLGTLKSAFAFLKLQRGNEINDCSIEHSNLCRLEGKGRFVTKPGKLDLGTTHTRDDCKPLLRWELQLRRTLDVTMYKSLQHSQSRSRRPWALPSQTSPLVAMEVVLASHS